MTQSFPAPTALAIVEHARVVVQRRGTEFALSGWMPFFLDVHQPGYSLEEKQL